MKKLYYTSFLTLAFAAILLQACGSAESAENKMQLPSASEAIPVKVMPLQQQALSQPIHSSGQFSTDDETTLSFKTGGMVARVLVKEGDFIKKGQLLATLDLTEIEGQVQQAELGYEKAKRDFSRAENLYRDSVGTLERLQDARTGMSIAKQQLETARFNLGLSEIRAVSNGYVLKRHANAGELVSPGSPILYTNGAGNATWIFKTGVSDKEWAILQPGDSALIRSDATSGKTISARVARKAEGADPQTGAFNLELKVDPRLTTSVEPQEQHLLASGLFGTATSFPSAKFRVWPIPHESLLDANANNAYVFASTDQDTARKLPVKIAYIDSEYVYISEGLEDAVSLITTGSAYLTDGSPIRVLPE